MATDVRDSTSDRALLHRGIHESVTVGERLHDMARDRPIRAPR
jgi:hypothetical protein